MDIFDAWKSASKYEKRFSIIVALTTVSNAFPILLQLFAHYTPTYHCSVQTPWRDTEDMHEFKDVYLDYAIPMEVDADGGLIRSSCAKYDLNSTSIDLIMQAMTLINSTVEVKNVSREIVKCDKFDFDFKQGETSAVGEFNMVCGNAWKRPTAVCVYMAGKLVGGFCGGIISDRFGRRFAFLMFTAMQFIVSFLLSFSTNFEMYCSLAFLNGIGSLVNYGAIFVLGCELVGPKQRNLIVFFVYLGYTFGYMLTPLIGYFIRNWRWFSRASGLIGIIYIPLYWMIDESPRWLFAVGRDEEAHRILKKISNYNGKEYREDDVLKFKHDETKGPQQKTESYFESLKLLLSRPRFAVCTLIVFSAWLISSMTYYMVTYNTNILSGNRFLNCFYAGLMEVVSLCLAFIILGKVGRRSTYIGFTIMSAVTIGGIPLFRLWSETSITVVTMGAKMGTVVGFLVIYIITTELFPTAIRHSVFGLASTFARVGGMLAPFILYSARESSETATCLVTGAVIFILTLLVIFIPETRNAPLPQTIEEAAARKTHLCRCSNEASDDHTVG